MALQTEEADVVGPGIQANAPTKGAFALNMLYKNNCWQVRKGFGQVSQFDTTLSMPVGKGTDDWGYGKQLGSHLIKTAFGNLQMVTIFLATCNTSTSSSSASFQFLTEKGSSAPFDIYIVHIYDLTTDERFEVPLYAHTSQKSYPDAFIDFVPYGTASSGFGRLTITAPSSSFFADAPIVQGQYQTNFSSDHQSWVRARDEFFYFEEFDGILYFGNRFTGSWAYRPTSFSSIRPIAVDKINSAESMRPYSESSIVVPVVFVPGESVASFEYFRTGDLPRPVDVANVLGRFYYAAGREIYISDTGSPNHIISLNFFQVPCREDIVAVAAQNGNLLIFTPNETWFYQPSVGPVASDGKLTQISSEIGCVSPNAIVDVGSSVVFVDTSGIYVSQGNLSIESISDDIQPFFTDTMPNPVTSFFLAFGATNPSETEYIRTTLRASFHGVKCSYSQDLGCLMVCFPDLNGALCQSEGRWSWWTFESMSTSNGFPGATVNLPSPWLLAHQEQLFLIAGPDEQTIVDRASTDTVLSRNYNAGNIKSRSFFICEYGRGGGIDRSVTDEDVRKFTGRTRGALMAIDNLANGYFLFGEPKLLPQGYNIEDSGGYSSNGGDPVVVSGEVYEVPISFVLNNSPATRPNFDSLSQDLVRDNNHAPGATVPGNWFHTVELRFKFDKAKYRPVIKNNNTTVLAFSLPSDRIGLDSLRILTRRRNASNNDDADGDYINIKYIVSASSPLLNSYYDGKLNAPIGRLNPFISIYMEKLSTDSDESGMGIDFDHGNAAMDTATLVMGSSSAGNLLTKNLSVLIIDRWSPSTTGSTITMRQQDSVAQPVDWAYRSASLGVNQGAEMKFRGMYANLLSHGRADEAVTPAAWQYGLFNVLVGSDRRDLAAQVVDFSNNSEQVKQQDSYVATGAIASPSQAFPGIRTIRTTFKNSSGALTNKAFAQQDGPVYDVLSAGAGRGVGDLLIGDEEVSDIAVSLGVKGQSFSVMMFGFIRNKAERLFVEGARAAFRIVGGRRRKGR